ncbi:MAG: 30S ribosomal protein S21, partial [Flavobacteriaceae bacterium]|nr:30S ribosomal protein S21 [Flavobacteriaceae bacterium]
MLIIKVKDGEKIDRALKRLKRKFRDTRVLQTLRDKKEFTKPSVLKR